MLDILLPFLSISFTAFPVPWQMTFQKPATSMMENIIDLHHDIFTFLLIIVIFVSLMLFSILISYTIPSRFVQQYQRFPMMQFRAGFGITHHTVLEIVWTIIPTLILLLIVTPSFALIYALDEIIEPQLTIRVVGRQWYWTYEYPDTVRLRVPVKQQSFGLEKTNVSLLAVLRNRLQDSNFTAALRRKTEGFGLRSDFFTQSHFLLLFQEHRSFFDFVWLCDQSLFWIAQERVSGFRKIFPWLTVAPSTYLSRVFLLVLPEFPSFLRRLGFILRIPGFTFSSYIVATEDLFPGAFRLLEVNRRVVLPFGTNIRLLLTSYDVIHSWAVPAFGLKVDCLPGRLNEYFLNVHYRGLFYGQCSEICGVNHGFMPIKVEVTTPEHFRWWFLVTSLCENSTIRFRQLWQFNAELTSVINLMQSTQLDIGTVFTFLESFLKSPSHIHSMSRSKFSGFWHLFKFFLDSHANSKR